MYGIIVSKPLLPPPSYTFYHFHHTHTSPSPLPTYSVTIITHTSQHLWFHLIAIRCAYFYFILLTRQICTYFLLSDMTLNTVHVFHTYAGLRLRTSENLWVQLQGSLKNRRKKKTYAWLQYTIMVGDRVANCWYHMSSSADELMVQTIKFYPTFSWKQLLIHYEEKQLMEKWKKMNTLYWIKWMVLLDFNIFQ